MMTGLPTAGGTETTFVDVVVVSEVLPLPPTGEDSRLSLILSEEEDDDDWLDTLVTPVDALLTTLTELASMELSVDAKLCFDPLLRSIVTGVDGALSPGLRFAGLVDDDGDEEGDDEEGEEGDARPRNFEAAALIISSDARTAFALLLVSPTWADPDSTAVVWFGNVPVGNCDSLKVISN